MEKVCFFSLLCLQSDGVSAAVVQRDSGGDELVSQMGRGVGRDGFNAAAGFEDEVGWQGEPVEFLYDGLR